MVFKLLAANHMIQNQSIFSRLAWKQREVKAVFLNEKPLSSSYYSAHQSIEEKEEKCSDTLQFRIQLNINTVQHWTSPGPKGFF